MIRLEVEEYCHACHDFTPDAIGPQRLMTSDGEVVLGDTIVRCEYRKRCANLTRYLEHQLKGDKE